MIDLDQMIETGAAHARTILLQQKKESLTPLWDIRTADGSAYIFGTPDYSDYRNETLSYIAGQLRAHHAQAFMFISEAWAATLHPHSANLLPSEREDRTEVVAIFARSRAEHRMLLLDIVRDASGKIVDLPNHRDIRDFKSLDGAIPDLFA